MKNVKRPPRPEEVVVFEGCRLQYLATLKAGLPVMATKNLLTMLNNLLGVYVPVSNLRCVIDFMLNASYGNDDAMGVALLRKFFGKELSAKQSHQRKTQ